MNRRLPALLVLEDGEIFRGVAFGAPGTVTGEVCFNTGMSGYQEVLTDPSYHGQIVTMTAPQIGNTGVNAHDDQSHRPWVAGFVVRELTEKPASWRSEGSLDDYLIARDITGISEVDTRRLTRHLRSRGAMRGVVSSVELDASTLVDIVRSSPSLVGRDLAKEVTTHETYRWAPEHLLSRSSSGWSAGAEASPATSGLLTALDTHPGTRIAAFDFGLKQNILDLLVASGCEVDVVPASTSSETILSGGYSGVFLSNGPGDPEPVDYAIDTIGRLLGQLPIFGICLGHQLLGLALGASTYKLPFGHRGSNHPVRRIGHDRVEITCQNHGFAVASDSIGSTPATLTHINLNDQTVEGLEVPGIAYSVQYHPESGPGPHDSRYLFEKFQTLINRFEPQPLMATR